jgi:hypothetical protein
MPAGHHEPTTLEVALGYAARGWRVLPVIPGQKRPPMEAWQHSATTDITIITNWFTGLYRNYGVGIATGPGSGFWALDVDINHAAGKHGDETLAELQAEHGPLPDTLTSITGSGGLHFLFRWNPDHDIRNNQSGAAGDWLDVRGDGGFIVVAPTVHPNGRRYEWEASTEHLEPVDAPAWLVELLTTKVERNERGDQQRTSSIRVEPTPGDRWAAETSWSEILTADGWTLSHTDRHGESH